MPDKKSVNILIVEDDPGHQVLIEDNLKKAGIINQIFKARDGQQALDFVFHQGEYKDEKKSPTPGLILLDISMPKVDGFEVLEKLKKDEKLKKIPVIMLTTTDSQKEIDRSYQLGANSYITKPVDFGHFREMIKNLGMFLDIVSFPE
jgi:CheY-like chemotaxis protein